MMSGLEVAREGGGGRERGREGGREGGRDGEREGGTGWEITSASNEEE